ncbi:MAG: xanthine dehydrogenase [Rhodospirillales bacterium 20-64-7]|nr:MAG: xanthine dehydrogenase [Rhodospirillales bacterium 20-64-7]
MQYDTPIGATLLDRETLVGKPVDRVDGILKVHGKATYSYEYREGGEAAYGFLLTAGSGKGKAAFIDTAKAEAAPGVLLVWTHENAPEQAEPSAETVPQLRSADIMHNGEAVALVVAETFEQARAAALMIDVQYETMDGAYNFHALAGTAIKPPDGMFQADTGAGDFDAHFSQAEVQIDVTYTTPNQSQAMMEPHATLAVWEGERVTLYTANQLANPAQQTIAATLRLDPSQVRVVARYVGGGFGSKLKVFGDAILAALAAKALGRPVKIALTRQQIFNHTSHRSPTIQRLRIGTGRDGKILALAHENIVNNLPGKTFFEPVALATTMLYGGAHRRTTHRMVEMDMTESASMRAPGEAVGMIGLECAMDELAEKLGMDPVELRIVNEPEKNPEDGTAYSARKLVECLRHGAELFGWDKRNKTPGSLRDGNFLIGHGVASAVRGNMLQPSKAEAVLREDGTVQIKTAMTDIGTGTYTILAQIAGEILGLPVEKIEVSLGDTDFPEGAGSGGSWGAASSGSSVYYACEALRAKITSAAQLDSDAVFEDGFVRSGNISKALTEIARAGALRAEGEIKPGEAEKSTTQAGYGAHFCEVGVDMDTGEVRIRRMLGVFAAGRILNAKTARSQALGGMVFGIGSALVEDLVVDTRYGYFVNHDLAEYHVPVHADVPDIEAIYLPELDDKANPLKAKGVGELGISGAAAAIANAVYNACGVRVRDFPITLDKLIAQMK